MTWRRNYSGSTFRGSAADGLSSIGDTIVLNGAPPPPQPLPPLPPLLLPPLPMSHTASGKTWPTLSLGDDAVQHHISMAVLSASSKENWLPGVATISHTYSTPNNVGHPPPSL